MSSDRGRSTRIIPNLLGFPSPSRSWSLSFGNPSPSISSKSTPWWSNETHTDFLHTIMIFGSTKCILGGLLSLIFLWFGLRLSLCHCLGFCRSLGLCRSLGFNNRFLGRRFHSLGFSFIQISIYSIKLFLWYSKLILWVSASPATMSSLILSWDPWFRSDIGMDGNLPVLKGMAVVYPVIDRAARMARDFMPAFENDDVTSLAVLDMVR